MNTELSHYWVVEYQFTGDSVHVGPLKDYLNKAEKAYVEGRLFDSVILGLHPHQDGARELGELLQVRRNGRSLSWRHRANEFRRYLDGLESGAKLEEP